MHACVHKLHAHESLARSFATWCGPCLLLATELEKVAATLGDKVKVLKIGGYSDGSLSLVLLAFNYPIRCG